MIWLPTKEQVMLLHQKLVDASGGSAGLRDAGLVESALARASAAFAGVEAYKGVEAKAAAVGCGLVQNHGFVDGNKRIGVAVMLLILRRNGVQMQCTCEEVTALGLAIAQGLQDGPDVVQWIHAHK